VHDILETASAPGAASPGFLTSLGRREVWSSVPPESDASTRKARPPVP
jgi:hypothetical protein